MKGHAAPGCVLLSRAAYDACDLPPDLVVPDGELEAFSVEPAAAGAVHALLNTLPALRRPASASALSALAPETSDSPLAEDECERRRASLDLDGPAARMSDASSRRSSVSGAQSAPLSRRRLSVLDGGGTCGAEDATMADVQLIRTRSARHFCVQLLAGCGLMLTHFLLGMRSYRLSGLLSCIAGSLYLLAVTAYVQRSRLAVVQRSWENMCITMFSATVALLVLSLMGHMLRHPAANCPGMRPSECARSFFRLLHVPIMPLAWVTAQLPARLVFFPELLRNVVYVGAALTAASLGGDLTLRYAAGVAAESIICAAVTPIVLQLLYAPPAAVCALLEDVDVCPRLLRHPRDVSVSIGAALRRRLLRNQVLLDMQSTLALSVAVLVATAAVSFHYTSVPHAQAASVSLILLTLGASFVVKLNPSAAQELDMLAASIAKVAHARALDALRARLDADTREAANLRAGCDALLALFPTAVACAAGTFAEGAASDVLAAVECAARDDAARRVLEESLPANVGAAVAGDSGGSSSVWRVCGARSGGGPLDSAECAGGLSACADWRTAMQAGLPSSRALTLPLNAGPVLVGFLTLHLGVFGSAAPSDNGISAATMASVKELCDAVAGAVFMHRAFALSRETFDFGMRAAGVPNAFPARGRTPMSPTRQFMRVDSSAADLTFQRSSSMASTAPRFCAEQDAAALLALDASQHADAALLAGWGLDAWALPDAEVCRLLSAMLHGLGLLRAFHISPLALEGFIDEVSCRYSDENAFHTFRHAFMVTHSLYLFLTESALRRTWLRDVDVLALMLSAICHDLEHGGVTNAFHVNSGSALSRRYNDVSINENHHCAVGFELMGAAGILSGLSAVDARTFRKLCVAAILATDMACHKELLARVTACLADRRAAAAAAAAVDPLVADAQQTVIVSFILHCVDLCCPLLPPPLSRRIAGDLSREFAAQAAAERAARLPVSVMEAPTELAKAKMEIGFLGAQRRARALACACMFVAPACACMLLSRTRG
jgi:high affinity cGMP-specific 3',5'-cyclic phosphodiesterase 9